MGTRKNRLAEALLTSTLNLCFEQKYENYQNFSSENFILVVKFSIYWNRSVFVMKTASDTVTRSSLWKGFMKQTVTSKQRNVLTKFVRSTPMILSKD